jgi:hypothetical protein
MKALQDGNVEITAIHNHLIGESPRIIYIHMGGHGDPVKMAQTIKQAVGLTKTPLPQGRRRKGNCGRSCIRRGCCGRDHGSAKAP